MQVDNEKETYQILTYHLHENLLVTHDFFSVVVCERGEKFQCLVILLSRESLEDGGDPIIRVFEKLEGSFAVFVGNLEIVMGADCGVWSAIGDDRERGVCGDEFGCRVALLGNIDI